jgi:hypothetical protein
VFGWCARAIRIIGTKEDVLDRFGLSGKIPIVESGIDLFLLMVSNHEQGFHSMSWRVFDFVAKKEVCGFVSCSIHHRRP